MMEDRNELLLEIAQLGLDHESLKQPEVEKEGLTGGVGVMKKDTWKATLGEYLMLYHTNLHEKMESDSATLYHTNYGITSPVGKVCPKRLALWDHFPASQQETLSKMWELSDLDKGILPRVLSPIADLEKYYEDDKQPFECTYVEDIVT